MDFFIGRVKRHPCLWKMSDIHYRDIGKTELAWKQIAKECGMEYGVEAKSLWKKLRDSHREAMRRRKSSGQATQKMKLWKYEALMEFVLTQTENCENSPNSPENDLNTDNSTNNKVTAPPPEPSSYFKQLAAAKTDSQQNRETRRDQKHTERDESRRNILDMNRQQDALLNLFTSFYQKTRELPRNLQLRVQREIFEAISRAEEEALSLDSTNSFNAMPSTSSSYRYTSVTNYQASTLSDEDPLSDTAEVKIEFGP